MPGRALILLGGASKIPEMHEGDLVICADSGFKTALENSLKVDHLVGDLDSLPPSYQQIAREAGVDIQEFPSDKDLADGEIALNLAMEKGCEKIIISGGKDGRSDHIMSTLFLPFLMSDRLRLGIWIDEDRVQLLREGDKQNFSGRWKVVSILPLQGGCVVTTDGLRWALRSERIDAGSTRGIHNEPTGEIFSIECESGSIFVMLSNQP